MRLSTKGLYALRAVLDIASNSKDNTVPVKLGDVAKRTGVELHYLEQLTRRLRVGGLLKPVRGPGGGYLLAKPVTSISIRDVLNNSGERMGLVTDKYDNEVLDATERYFQRVNRTLNTEFNTTYLADLLK